MANHASSAHPPAGGADADPRRPAAPEDPDAPHVQPNLSYIPGLDGARAFAVLGVMAFHGGVSFMSAGFLGVDAFFVLSGFLITSLLIAEWQRIATIRLGTFWARRARRLLPALLLVLLAVAAYAAFVVPRGTYPGLRLDSLSTLFYVANWHFILTGSDYFNQTGLPSPLTHTWSLAIEEQFYLVWPIVVLVVLRLTRTLRPLLAVAAGGAVASAVWMAVLYPAGGNLTRLYYGTDTHAQCLLVGATMAIGLAMLAQRRRAGGWVASGPVVGGDPAWAAGTSSGRAALIALGLAGFGASAYLWTHLDGSSPFLYQGGFLVVALATAAVLLCAVCAQRSIVARGLSLGPLRYLGRISYGMYLWHYPLFIYLDGARTGLSGWWLFAVRTGATVAVATVSFYLVERPIRQGTFLRSWRAWLATPLAAVATVVALVAATAAPAVAVGGPGLAAGTSARSGPPVHAVLFGDSVALTLGLGLDLPQLRRAYNVTESDHGILGCGVAIGADEDSHDVVVPVASACNPDPSPGQPQWPAQWAAWLHQEHPDVVMILAGRWETVGRTYAGRWTTILDPAYQAYVKRQLELAVQVASSGGAHVVLLTAPCFSSGEQPDGQPWPEDSAARLDAYNALVRQVAAEDPRTTSLVDLDALVCPGGHFATSLDGTVIRRSDGVHFTVLGGGVVGTRLWPEVLKTLGPADGARTGGGP
ncbi:MAG TPA: acyltransferase family protein [Acidimicrobiales bacterium]|nr:acyltransferase family protein [Acidimicrobiales bacterium]